MLRVIQSRNFKRISQHHSVVIGERLTRRDCVLKRRTDLRQLGLIRRTTNPLLLSQPTHPLSTSGARSFRKGRGGRSEPVLDPQRGPSIRPSISEKPARFCAWGAFGAAKKYFRTCNRFHRMSLFPLRLPRIKAGTPCMNRFAITGPMWGFTT